MLWPKWTSAPGDTKREREVRLRFAEAFAPGLSDLHRLPAAAGWRMNRGSGENLLRSLAWRLRLGLRWLEPRPTLTAFDAAGKGGTIPIQAIYVINLDRQSRRWRRMQRELRRVRGGAGRPLLELTTRFPAIDARDSHEPPPPGDIESVYSLADQLFVQPEPLLARASSGDDAIRMTRQEIAVARSHVEVWRRISRSSRNYALVIEDDVYFKRDAGVLIDRAWSDLSEWMGPDGSFDMLYLSYRESGPTTEKKFVTDTVFKPVRGLWHMSGYVLSRRGAERLLALLPVRGPVDIWINHQFDKIDVFATSRCRRLLCWNSSWRAPAG